MNVPLFTYGSLMFPEVWRHVVRGDYRSAPALADGYRRYAVTGEAYPGMVAQPGAHTAGVVYFDVSAEDVARLDAFEGIDYLREIIAVSIDGAPPRPAATYLYRDAARLAALPWEPGEFDLRGFVDTYCPSGPV